MTLPRDGKLGGSGSGQPPSSSPSLSATDGLTDAGKRKKPGGFAKSAATGSLDMDLRIGRMGASYMHNPAFGHGAEKDTNEPHHDHHGDAHKHMDHARKAETTDEKRKHVFNALSSLNRAKKRGY